MKTTIAVTMLTLLVILTGCRVESNSTTNINFEDETESTDGSVTDGETAADGETTADGETAPDSTPPATPDSPATTPDEPVPGTTPKKPLGPDVSVAFVTNQIADFWQIAKAGCEDAQQDLDINVEVRMPSQATAVEQKRIGEERLESFLLPVERVAVP